MCELRSNCQIKYRKEMLTIFKDNEKLIKILKKYWKYKITKT